MENKLSKEEIAMNLTISAIGNVKTITTVDDIVAAYNKVLKGIIKYE